MPTAIDVKVEGIAPILQHRRPLPEEEGEPDATERSGRPDWAAEAETAFYKLEDGTICQPSDHVHAALLKAAVNFQIPGKGKKTYKDLVNSALVVEPDQLAHIHQDYTIDRRWVTVSRSKVLRHRPRLEKWALKFRLIVTDDQFPVKVVRQILDYAGRYVGIGDYRPKFGRFMVTEWRELDGDAKTKSGKK